MKLDKETVSEVRMYVDHDGLQYLAMATMIHPATLSDIYHDKENVSREKENMVRQWAGLSILPSFETVEVPPGCKVAIVNAKAREAARPKRKRKRKKRYSVPAEPEAAARYLMERMAPSDARKLREHLFNEMESAGYI